MIEIQSIEKNKDKWFKDKFACKQFCEEHEIDIWDDENLEDNIYEALCEIMESDEEYNDYLRYLIGGHEEALEYVSKVCVIILDGTINARQI